MSSPPDDRTEGGHLASEVGDAAARYVALREAIGNGDATWTDLADLFTADVVYIDPAWGRIEGIAALREFLDESMRGLDDWSFPIEYTAVTGDTVVVKWTQQLPGSRPDGSRYEQSGYSTLLYGGDGKFCYEEDLLNMVHVFEDLKASRWRPLADMVPPPADPDRRFGRDVGTGR